MATPLLSATCGVGNPCRAVSSKETCSLCGDVTTTPFRNRCATRPKYPTNTTRYTSLLMALGSPPLHSGDMRKPRQRSHRPATFPPARIWPMSSPLPFRRLAEYFLVTSDALLNLRDTHTASALRWHTSTLPKPSSISLPKSQRAQPDHVSKANTDSRRGSSEETCSLCGDVTAACNGVMHASPSTSPRLRSSSPSTYVLPRAISQRVAPSSSAAQLRANAAAAPALVSTPINQANIFNHGEGNSTEARSMALTEGMLPASSSPPVPRGANAATRFAAWRRDPANTPTPFPAAAYSGTAGLTHSTDRQPFLHRDPARTKINRLVIELLVKTYRIVLGVPAFDSCKNLYTLRELKFRERNFADDLEEEQRIQKYAVKIQYSEKWPRTNDR
ncbi:hypothetical protein HPB52_015219 [Rhipicephalus sanguineus]|uniref:Uncharacterized protein n=1 Tax=Rhipicephalus sanguineus TaxID=34632 RepID=A0A9D4TAK1_RHISA|nr:hypothetical protein HPB52_015219 [Rhipicephalus sanguineus]